MAIDLLDLMCPGGCKLSKVNPIINLSVDKLEKVDLINIYVVQP